MFKKNLPGIEWANSIIKRHVQQISNRTARNITYSRVSVNEEVVNEFFNNLEKELEGVVKRGCKYPENIKKFF